MQTCGICGKPLGNDVTIDHVFPQAIYKWSEETLPHKEYLQLKNRICGRANRIKAHAACNYAKQDELFSTEHLFLDRAKKETLAYLEEHIREHIAAYAEKKRKLLSAQEQKCYWCKTPIEGPGIIRRIDPKKARVMENACIVCAACNRQRADYINPERPGVTAAVWDMTMCHRAPKTRN